MAPKAVKAKASKPAVFVAEGLTALGRAKTYKRRGLAFIKKKNGGKFPTHPKAEKEEAPATTTKFYAPEDAPKPIYKKVNKKPTKLRSSITPGTVLILLAGRFKGKRVVFLKQLESGLLLVTGPFKVNGVPLRRVNQAYVIATCTKLDVSGVDVSALTDKDFRAEKKAKKSGKKSDSEFFEQAVTKKALSEDFIARQKKVDTALLAKLDATQKGYLGARFSLKDGDRPHLMKF